MIPHDDWSRWGEDWQRQPPVDLGRLRARVRRKLWQMRMVIAFEWLVSLVAAGQLVRVLFMPAADARWKLWAVLVFVVLIAPTPYLSLRVRRGTWRAPTGSVSDLLRLTARRARAGIRIAWINILSIPLLLAITLPIAAPWLAPSRWRHDPAFRHMLILNVGFCGTIFLVALVFFVFFLRRQRRRLRQVEALLREEDS
ncbi:hypothetical protein [Dyella sp. A6]|uniref:hypothetical protein n=1 Tax=Dyella aluminiiresistens TaxID=3069105 RepID=UPI002E7A6651|nr:hypothetical protein [Dyella sp. A6]